MQTYKTVLLLYVLMFFAGISMGFTDLILIAFLGGPFMLLYSIIMFFCGHRSWYLLLGALAGAGGIFMFVMLLAALAMFV